MHDTARSPWVTRLVGFVLIIVLAPLWWDLAQPGITVWNIVLALMLVGIAVGALALQVWLVRHIGEVGEARFDTRNDKNG